LIRGAFQALLEGLLLFKNKPYRLTFKSQKIHLVKLLKTGFPIYVVGQINNIWVTVMNNLLFVKGGATNYGLYALANMLLGITSVVPNAFGQVIYPRMSIMLGEGQSFNHIVKSNLKPLYLQFALLLGIALVGALLLPVVIPWLLPKYTDGIVPAQWMLFVPAVQAFGSLNNLYNVVKTPNVGTSCH
jgi:O-antigen/teichoic acid export membrane protein